MSLSKNLHHVVVALTEPSKKRSSSSSSSSSSYIDEVPLEQEVKLLDNRSLLLRLVNTPKSDALLPPRYYRHMEFDAVGHEYEPHIRCELTELIDNLLKRKQSSCLVRISPVRTSNMNLLTRLLVAEVDKVILAMRYRLTSIHLEYYDIRKFDMINLLAQQHPEQSISTGRRRKQSDVQRMCFQSTRELFQWLLTNYTMLRGCATGDDYIDVEFSFSDIDQKKHKVHLSLFQVFANAPEPRNDLMDFFKSLVSGRNPRATLLTDCLKESFDLSKPLPTLLFFEVPLIKDAHLWAKKMFRLADAAFVNIRMARQTHAGKAAKQAASLDVINQPVSKLHMLRALRSTTSSSATSTDSRPSATSNGGSAGQRFKPMMQRPMSGDFTVDDYNSLSYWYACIDKKLQEVREAMKEYYGAVYRNKVLKICNEIKTIGNCEGIGDSNCNDLKSQLSIDMEQVGSTYADALAEFNSLDLDVEKSTYAATLKVYLSTKGFELTQAEEELKRKELENLHARVIDYVRRESMNGS